jgi:hypothetical protein
MPLSYQQAKKRRRIMVYRRLHVSFSSVVLLVLCLTIGQAHALKPQIQAVGVAGKLQAIVLRAMNAFVGDAVVDKAGRLKAEDIASFDNYSASLKKLIGYNQPGQERTTKYFDKMIQTDLETRTLAYRFISAMEKSGQPDRELVFALDRKAGQYRYATDEMIRHLIKDLDVSRLSETERRQYMELLQVIRLENELQGVVYQAYKVFADIPAYDANAVSEFWSRLGRFEFSAAIYAGYVSFTTENKKSAYFTELKALKHEIKMNGQKILVSAQKTSTPDMEATRALRKATQGLSAVFDGLVAEIFN